MMRNALRTLVPAEVLERRRKGARSRSVLLTLKHQEQKIGTLVESLPPAMTVLVDQHVLQRVALEAARSGDLRRVHEVLRAIFVRLWNHTDFCSTRDPRALPELAKV